MSQSCAYPVSATAPSAYLAHIRESDLGVIVTSRPGKYTPLHFAASRGFLDVVSLLIDHGANVNASNKWLWTPMHLAAAEGHTGVVIELAKRGADIKARTVHTNLPLDEATGSHHWKTASVLKRLMGPDWYRWARKSYHDNPGGEYVYDRIETVTDDEVALFWQNTVRAAVGPKKFGEMFDGEDPMSALRIELDPSVRQEVGWVDSDGEYHAPWEDADADAEELSSSAAEDDSSAFGKSTPPSDLLV